MLVSGYVIVKLTLITSKKIKIQTFRRIFLTSHYVVMFSKYLKLIKTKTLNYISKYRHFVHNLYRFYIYHNALVLYHYCKSVELSPHLNLLNFDSINMLQVYHLDKNIIHLVIKYNVIHKIFKIFFSNFW